MFLLHILVKGDRVNDLHFELIEYITVHVMSQCHTTFIIMLSPPLKIYPDKQWYDIQPTVNRTASHNYEPFYHNVILSGQGKPKYNLSITEAKDVTDLRWLCLCHHCS